jgi:hypothetical protein
MDLFNENLINQNKISSGMCWQPFITSEAQLSFSFWMYFFPSPFFSEILPVQVFENLSKIGKSQLGGSFL